MDNIEKQKKLRTLNHKKRIIKKRKNILKHWGSNDMLDYYSEKENKLSKHNLSCSCKMCKDCRKTKTELFKKRDKIIKREIELQM